MEKKMMTKTKIRKRMKTKRKRKKIRKRRMKRRRKKRMKWYYPCRCIRWRIGEESGRGCRSRDVA
jgi:hypothetical protein